MTTTTKTDNGEQGQNPVGGPLRKLLMNSLGGRAVLATIALLIVGAIIAPSTLSPSSILSLLPFVAFLSIAAIGQHLVIQQRGLDISIAAIMSFAAVIVTKLPASGASTGEVLLYVALALLMGLVAGAVNGVIITLLKVPSLVTTIGVNSILFGITLMVSESVPSQAAPQFAQFVIGLSLGVPNSIWIAALVAAVSLFILERTSIGRRFIATSVSPKAAHAVAIPVERYQIATYIAAGLCYSIAGVLLAGFLSVPSIFCGNPYILASVAAVVVGGNSVAGGARGSILATIVGAIFLTYLGQLVLSAGMERSMQNVVEALIVIGGVGLPMLLNRSKVAVASVTPTAVAATSFRSESETMPVLQLKGIKKSFGAVQALKGVDFTAYPGEIHAIVGENGAGKSTMIGVAAGMFRADAGSILLKGHVASEGPRARREQGISVAYQHPEIPSDLSVYENLLLAAPDITEEAARKLIARIATTQLQMDIHLRVEELSLAQRHVVEIARALASNPSVLILDEPTEPFQQNDIEQLFALIRNLREQGIAIVYVSHRLHEVTALADRISIMRDGEMVASRKAADITASEIVRLIAGRPLEQIFPAKSTGAKEVMLDVRNLSGDGFHDVSLQARAGEIIGLAGIEGEGQRQFLRAIGAIDRYSSGSIHVAGVGIDGRGGPEILREAGVGFVSDDRHGEGLFLNLSVRENIGIGVIDAVSSSGLMDRARERSLVSSVSEGLRIRTPSIETLVSDLSGGNQQKVLFGRELSGHPKVLLVDEPTKGVDIGARAEIYQQLRKLADDGTAIIVAASDGVELEGLCDRVFIFARGGIVRELTGSDVNDTTITEANLTATASRAVSTIKSAARKGWQKFFASDHFPAAILIALTGVILFGTNSINEFFLSGFNITQMLGLLAILCFIALGQFIAILVGGIDLSVGPLAGLVVVLASFLLPRDASGGMLVGGTMLLLALCVAFGYLQGVLITKLQLPAIVVTLATFIGLQGVSLLLRPRPKGTISNTLSDVFGYPVLGVPAGMVLAILAVIGFERLLYRHAAGRQLRAVGSNMLASHRLGVDGGRVIRIAFAITGLLTGIAGLMLAGQIGIGSGTTGVDFSLMSITAVVLGGVSVAGGRGSALCVALGAAMAQATTSASSFLSPDASWYYTVLGIVTLVGASLFSIARWSRRAARFSN